MTCTQVDARRRYNGGQTKSVFRFFRQQELINPISRIEKFLKLKLARKVTIRSKKYLAGFWDNIAPGSVVTGISPTTTVIREPGESESSVRNNDNNNFGSKEERITPIWEYAKISPIQKTTEEKIMQHTRNLKTKYRGDRNSSLTS